MAERVEEELELEGMSRDEARSLLMELGIDADGTMADGVLVNPAYDSDESSLVLRMSVPADAPNATSTLASAVLCVRDTRSSLVAATSTQAVPPATSLPPLPADPTPPSSMQSSLFVDGPGTGAGDGSVPAPPGILSLSSAIQQVMGGSASLDEEKRKAALSLFSGTTDMILDWDSAVSNLKTLLGSDGSDPFIDVIRDLPYKVFRSILAKDLIFDSPPVVLGRGGFGTVYRVRIPALGSGYFAIKVSSSHSGDARHIFIREATIITVLSRHENLVRVFGCVDDLGQSWSAETHHLRSHKSKRSRTKRPRYALVMEYVDATPLYPAPEDGSGASVTTRDLASRIHIITAVASALGYLHDNGVAHLDVKPANILAGARIEDIRYRNKVKLTDFGLSRRFDSDPWLLVTGPMGGTPGFLGPECWSNGKRVDLTKVDVYAFGVTAALAIIGDRNALYTDSSMKALRPMAEVLADVDGVLMDAAPNVRDPLSSLVRACVNSDPAARPPFTTINAVLQGLPPHLRAALEPPFRGSLCDWLTRDRPIPPAVMLVCEMFPELFRAVANVEADTALHPKDLLLEFDDHQKPTIRLNPDGGSEPEDDATASVFRTPEGAAPPSPTLWNVALSLTVAFLGLDVVRDVMGPAPWDPAKMALALWPKSEHLPDGPLYTRLRARDVSKVVCQCLALCAFTKLVDHLGKLYFAMAAMGDTELEPGKEAEEAEEAIVGGASGDGSGSSGEVLSASDSSTMGLVLTSLQVAQVTFHFAVRNETALTVKFVATCKSDGGEVTTKTVAAPRAEGSFLFHGPASLTIAAYNAETEELLCSKTKMIMANGSWGLSWHGTGWGM